MMNPSRSDEELIKRRTFVFVTILIGLLIIFGLMLVSVQVAGAWGCGSKCPTTPPWASTTSTSTTSTTIIATTSTLPSTTTTMLPASTATSTTIPVEIGTPQTIIKFTG